MGAIKNATATNKRRSGAPADIFKFRTTDGWLIVQQKGENGISKWSTVCSPIELVALTRDGNNRNWGVYIKITDPDRRLHQIAIPAALLVGSRGDPVFELLAGFGCKIDPSFASRKALLRFLNSTTNLDSTTLPRAIAAVRTGWHDTTFVLPDRAIGSAEKVIYQSTSEIRASISENGALKNWQNDIAARAEGNSRLVLGISAAFAAPLLGPLQHSEGFGIHLRGGSSTGKTTALVVAGSVWGGGGLSGYKQSWQATANGIEAMAEAHNDLLLTLDELGQVNPEDAGRVAYQLASGVGRQRALQSGMGASRKEWRLIFLSTGEIGLDSKLREARAPLRMMAGQGVRFIDIPADAGKGFGLFDEAPPLNEDPSGSPNQRGAALSDLLTSAAQRLYGTAGPAFLEAFNMNREEALRSARIVMAEVSQRLAASKSDGQVQRVARHFGLLAAAGEMATSVGIVPWTAGEASRAATQCFEAWIESRGTIGATEIEDTIAYLRGVIERDGASRFQRVNVPTDKPTPNRLGYVRQTPAGDTEYLIMPEAWKTLMIGRDPKRAACDLLERGILRAGESGRPQRKERVTQNSNPQRVYVVSLAQLSRQPDDPEPANCDDERS